MYGSVAGTSAFVKVWKRDRRRTRATFQYSCGIDLTPDIVLITVGHIEQSPIVNSAAGSDFWNTTKPSGNHASGEIGRRICTMGSNIRWNVRERPSRNPSGVPRRIPTRKPFATRHRL